MSSSLYGPSNNGTWMGVSSDSSARNEQADYPCRFQGDEHFLFGHEAPSSRFDGTGSDFGTFYDSDSEMSRQSIHYDLGRLCGEGVSYLSRQGSLDLKDYQASDLFRHNTFNLHHEAGSALPCEASSDLHRHPAAFGVGHAAPEAAASGLGNGMALCRPSSEQTRREAHEPGPSERHFAPLHIKFPEANFVAPGAPRRGHGIARPMSAVASGNFLPLGMMMHAVKQKPQGDRKRKHL